MAIPLWLPPSPPFCPFPNQWGSFSRRATNADQPHRLSVLAVFATSFSFLLLSPVLSRAPAPFSFRVVIQGKCFLLPQPRARRRCWFYKIVGLILISALPPSLTLPARPRPVATPTREHGLFYEQGRNYAREMEWRPRFEWRRCSTWPGEAQIREMPLRLYNRLILRRLALQFPGMIPIFRLRVCILSSPA